MTLDQARRRADPLRRTADPSSGATENERRQAAELLAALEAEHPSVKKQTDDDCGFVNGLWTKGGAANPDPSPRRGPTSDPFAGFGGFSGWYTHTYRTERENPQAKAAREDRERKADAERHDRLRKETVHRQRCSIVAVAFWRLSPVLTRLHEIDGVWSTEEAHAFTAERSRTFGGRGPTPDALCAATCRLARSRLLDLTDEEGRWVKEELRRAAKDERVSVLALEWLAYRVPESPCASS